ncbi:hypothetical protein F511_00444 [Dorcoceras hygrometricum]|uniref:Arf-GAP domain-containing protein n=1 Tax=Dorcoceras hygrometricum TaxID=472368 RepID=A0A2Z7BBL7_9LAMI|nr:hypothetical protein F511_00444 [Dorcoceras hygrometricum]
MPPRIKEEERIEKIIRGLLKQPENKRCINCNILGPQYVCTTFWTFVCTNCSGVHREFTHRVKSVSMAKFNAEEVSALQAGGNERARQIYFKTWDPQRNFYPDGSNMQRLREFVRHVYVERKFAGGNSSDRLSMVESDRKKEDSYEARSSEKSSLGGKDFNLERGSFEKCGKSGNDDSHEGSSSVPRLDGKSFKDTVERSHSRYGQENIRPGGQRSRSRFEIVDDRFRDDGIVKHYDRYSHREARGNCISPSSMKHGEMSFPEIRPLKDILGDKVPPLTIDEPPDASASNQDSTDGNKIQKGILNLSCLIDFDDNPGPQGQLKDSDKFDEDKASDAKVNTLESLLFEYSVPVTSPSGSLGATEDLISSSTATDDGSNNAVKISDSSGTISASKMYNVSIFSSNSSDPTGQITELHQPKNSSPVLNDPNPVSNVSFHKPLQVDEAGHGSTPNQRKELPEDLFASDFTTFTPAVPGWQLHPTHVTNLQPPPTSATAFLNATKPSNPFDIGNERPQAQATVLPSMSSFQGALPNVSSGTILQPHPSPYTLSFSPHAAPYPINSPQDKMYSCSGGCYNQCYPSVENQSEKFSCYYKCLDGCIPRTAADFQYYCQLGCYLKLCILSSTDGAAVDGCLGKCANLCML